VSDSTIEHLKLIQAASAMAENETTDAEILSELENAQTTLVRMADDFANGRLKGDQTSKAIEEIKARLREVVPEDSRAFPPIDRASLAPIAVWSHFDGYLGNDHPIVFWLKAIHNAITAIRPVGHDRMKSGSNPCPAIA